MKKYKIMDLAKNFIRRITDGYKDIHIRNSTKKIDGGQQRKLSGSLQEKTMWCLLRDICIANGLFPGDFKIKKGDNKNSGFRFSNPGGEINVGVDLHLYIWDRLVLVIECKTYLDSTFLLRAHTTIAKIKSVAGNEKVKGIITAMEISLDASALGYWMNEAVIDRCYFFVPGTRSSVKQIYLKEYWKEMKKEVVEDMIEYIFNIVEENIDDDEIEHSLPQELFKGYEGTPML